VHCEQSPQSTGQIRLDTERDPLGFLRAKVSWRASPQELHSIRTFIRVLGESLQVRGLGRIIADPGIERDDDALIAKFRESYHHIGGTRMAITPTQGVVDPDLRVFGTENLYICSTSVFPSAGFANPTHTLLALAVRLADRLAMLADATRSHSVPDTATTDAKLAQGRLDIDQITEHFRDRPAEPVCHGANDDHRIDAFTDDATNDHAVESEQTGEHCTETERANGR
jgi:hypothetical protein